MILNLLKKLDLHKKNKHNVKKDTLKLKKELSEICPEKDKIQLQEELREVCLEMEKTNRWFQMEVDSDLIDACIHQREVLNARYRYLMNKIKPLESQ